LDFTTLDYAEHAGVAWVTLDRPDVHNAFDDVMQEELRSVWQSLRVNDDVRAVVLTGAGEKAFCTGIDRSNVPADEGEFFFDPYTYDDPGTLIGPKSQGLWKPVVAAVNGMACGGAFYMLGEADVIIAAEHATFFDPHVTYGMPAVFEPTLMLSRMPFGELLRMTLLGNYERISAARAEQIGLVSEVVPYDGLRDAAAFVAESIAAQPAAAVQASLRTMWAARDVGTQHAVALGNVLLNLSMTPQALAEGQAQFSGGQRVKPRVR